MDGIIILLFVFFVLVPIFNAFKASTKAKPSKPVRSSMTSKASRTPRWQSPEYQELKKTLQVLPSSRSSDASSDDAKQQRRREYEARRRQSQAEEARRERRLKAHDAAHGNTVEQRDIHDKNRHRRADWGARAGPGIVNTKTVLTLIVLGGILAFILPTV